MADLYLMALMRGEISARKDPAVPLSPFQKKINLAIKKQLQAHVSALNIDTDRSQLLSPAMQREKLIAEIEEANSSPELGPYLNSAFRTLLNESLRYLDDSSRQEVELAIFRIPGILNQMDVNRENTADFQTLLEISDSVLTFIAKIAQIKFVEEDYNSSLSLFILLSTLAPTNGAYWLRTGIAAQKAKNYDLALAAYGAAKNLDPQLAEPILFSVQCYLELNNLDQAKSTLKEAKELIHAVEVDEIYREYLKAMESALAN